MLQVQDVSKFFGDVLVLDAVSLQISQGERVGMVGANGTGKSTLLRIVAGEYQPDGGQIALAPGRRPAYLPQDAGVRPGHTLHDELLSVFAPVLAIEEEQRALEAQMGGLGADEPRLMALIDRHAHLQSEFDRLDGDRVEAEIGTILAGLGFSRTDYGKLTEQFSGGWQVRIALAKLLLRRPDLLLLDEPTNHLDLAAVEWLEEYLIEKGLTALIVSHDRYFLDRVTQRTLELTSGGIEEYAGSYSHFVVERASRRAARADAAARQHEYLARQREFVERFRASATKSSQAKSREKMLDRIERIEAPEADEAIAFHFSPCSPSGRDVVKLTRVGHGYDGRAVLGEATLQIERGERIGLVGPNGAGKSTLLRLIAGLEKPARGTVALGQNARLAYFAQDHAEALNPNLTVHDEVHLASPPGTTSGTIRSLLGRFLIQKDDVFKPVGVLSGGERSRVALAKLLLRPSNLLLLDEPTNHLDVASRETLEEALLAFEGTIAIASHDRYLLDRLATRIVHVEAGEVRPYLGNYSSYRRKLATERLATQEARAVTAQHARADAPPRPAPTRSARGKAGPSPLDAARECARLERQLDELHARLGETTAALGAPDAYGCPSRVAELTADYERLQAAIESVTRRWEELAELASQQV